MFGWLRKVRHVLPIAQQASIALAFLGVPVAWLPKAVAVLKLVAQLSDDNDDRRKRAQHILMSQGLSEHDANAVIEIALKVVKS